MALKKRGKSLILNRFRTLGPNTSREKSLKGAKYEKQETDIYFKLIWFANIKTEIKKFSYLWNLSLKPADYGLNLETLNAIKLPVTFKIKWLGMKSWISFWANYIFQCSKDGVSIWRLHFASIQLCRPTGQDLSGRFCFGSLLIEDSIWS